MQLRQAAHFSAPSARVLVLPVAVFTGAESPSAFAELPQPRLGDRSLFPQLEAAAYLAHAAISPASLFLTHAVSLLSDTVARGGVASFPLYHAQRERLRSSIAAMHHVEPEAIALSAGCTRGITDIALSLPWQEGEVLLSFVGEFPANVTPWQLAAKERGAHVHLLPLPRSTSPSFVEELLSTLKEAYESPPVGRRVSYLAVSAVQFQTGVRMPVRRIVELSKRYSVRVFVDGIQGAGVTEQDLSAQGVDAFFVGAHKWLLGLEGAGYFYVAPGLQEVLHPRTAGWLSHPESENFLFRGPGHLRYDRPLLKNARVFEGSTANAIGLAALESGLDLCRRLSPAAIFAHVQAYHDLVEPALTERGFRSLRGADQSLRSTLLSFEFPEGVDASKFALALRQEGVVVSIPDGFLRLSPHFSNHEAEIPELLAAVDRALGSR